METNSLLSLTTILLHTFFHRQNWMQLAKDGYIAALSNFNFENLYRPGNQNADADELSRIPPETIKATSCTCMNQIPLIESLTISSQVIDDNFQEFPNEPEINIRQKQCCDPVLRFWYYLVRNNYKPQKFQLLMTNMKDHLLILPQKF